MKNQINIRFTTAFTSNFSKVLLLAAFFVSVFNPVVHSFPLITRPGFTSTSSCDWLLNKPNFRCENNRCVMLSSSNDEMDSEEKEDLQQVMYSALSPEEISAWLSSVEVYALMATADEDGRDERIHLLYGPDGSAVTYFFISSQAANAMASQLKEIGGGDLSITSFSLGKVWFGLLDPKGSDRVEGVEYRLVPDPRDLNGAKTLVMESSNSKNSCSFQSPFNEIPTFLDVRMRIPGSEVVDDQPVEQLPIYLGLQNIIQASEKMKEAEDSLPSSLSAEINVVNLSDLVKQMQEESTINFRKSVLVPPTSMQ